MRSDHRVGRVGRVGRLVDRRPVVLLMSGILASCSSLPDPGPELDVLASWMEGSFSSAQQAGALPSDFYDIRLETRRIWTHRSDGIWLYVEQANAKSLDAPYRQRVYCLESRGFGRATSTVYTLPEPALDFAGAWKRPELLHSLKREDLAEREGCTIYLEKQALAWVGGTRGRGCASSLRGAAYATSIVRIFADRLESWDRGFSANGEQVWGSTAGAYIFAKTSKVER